MGCVLSKCRAIRDERKARKEAEAPIVLEGLTISDPMPLGPRTEIHANSDELRLDSPQIVFNRGDDLYARTTRFGVVAEHVAPDEQKDGDIAPAVPEKDARQELPTLSEQGAASESGGGSGRGSGEAGPSSGAKSI
ncbi:hypothetical protein ACHAPU_008806 [Fusarium lateritium]